MKNQDPKLKYNIDCGGKKQLYTMRFWVIFVKIKKEKSNVSI